MNASRQLGSLFPFLALALAGCSSTTTTGPQSAAGSGYDVKGKVVAIAVDKPAVTLDHEDIPGLMKAMKMEFRVADPKLVEGLKPGDHVRGRVKKTDSGYLITTLKKDETP